MHLSLTCSRLSLVAVVAVAALAAPAAAQAYRVQFSSPVTVALPVPAVVKPVVQVRAADGCWRPADCRLEQGRLVISLDPARLGGSRAMLLVNPPADMDIADARAPRLTAARVGRDYHTARSEIFLGVASDWPRRIVLSIADAENALDPRSLSLSLDGAPLTRRVRLRNLSPRAVTVRARLPKSDYGDHVLRYAIADASPQGNTLEGTIRFARFDMTNYVLAAHGTKLSADSYFSSYPSLACLQDGDVKLPGNTLPNDISWASEETGTPHWVQVDFDRPRSLHEVVVYWANYSHEPHTARVFEVQVPAPGGWQTLYRSPEGGEKPAACTTAGFAPRTVTRFRVFQPAGAGSPSRPNLMWLAEIEAR